MKRTCLFAVLGMIGGLPAAQAADLQVAGGNHQILNQPNQVIDLYVTGGAAIGGFDLALQIGDGLSGPKITAVDLESGIFLDKHSGQSNMGSTDWATIYYITTESDPVVGDGLLLRLTLDATDVPNGSYGLALTGVEFPVFGVANSVFVNEQGEVPTTFVPGTISVVPEPAMASLMSLVGVAMLPRRRRP